MSYTHIQCIGYQVPTVAKVFDNTAPSLNPQIPSSFLPPENVVPYTSTPVHLYNPIGKTLNLPPNAPDYQAWQKHATKYLGLLIRYLETHPNPRGQIKIELDALIHFLKFYTLWGYWTIPSVDSNENPVSIIKAINPFLPPNEQPNAYELKASKNTHLTALNNNIDAMNRVTRFLNVLHKTFIHDKIDNRETTLKVFTAPEFYFRPKDTINNNTEIYRAYTETVYRAIKDVLRETIKGMGLNHWLIVPGTIMWYMPKDASKNIDGKTVKLSSNTYFNSTIVIWDGKDENKKPFKRKLEKSIASYIDGVPHPHNTWDYGANAPAASSKYRTSHLRKHLFNIDAVKTGLEICLEHIQGFHKASDNTLHPLVKYMVQNNKDLDNRHLQLLVAGGMGINLPSIALRDKGVFFRNDGFYLAQNIPVGAGTENRYVDAATNTRTNLVPTTLTHMPVPNAHTISLNGNAALELKSPAAPWPANPTDLVNTSQYLLPKTVPFNQQKIVIFKPQQIS